MDEVKILSAVCLLITLAITGLLLTIFYLIWVMFDNLSYRKKGSIIVDEVKYKWYEYHDYRIKIKSKNLSGTIDYLFGYSRNQDIRFQVIDAIYTLKKRIDQKKRSEIEFERIYKQK